MTGNVVRLVAMEIKNIKNVRKQLTTVSRC